MLHAAGVGRSGTWCCIAHLEFLSVEFRKEVKRRRTSVTSAVHWLGLEGISKYSCLMASRRSGEMVNILSKARTQAAWRVSSLDAPQHGKRRKNSTRTSAE
jgi:hypothetical protein